MTKLGFHPDVVTFNTLLHGLCVEDRVSEALHFFHQMECRPDVVTVTTLMNGLWKDGRHGDAQNVFSEMQEKGIFPNLFTYNCMINGFCSSGRWSEAQRLLREMFERKISPDVVTYNALINTFVKEGKFFEAEELYDEMLPRGIVPDTITFNSDGFCIQNRLDAAEHMFYLMATKGCSPDIITFNTLIDGYCRAKRVDDGMELLHEMTETGLVANTITYTTLIHGFCQVGDLISNSNMHARQPIFEQPSKVTRAPGNNNRNESQFGEQRNIKSVEATHYRKPSMESVSGLEDINEDAATSDPWRASDRQNSTDGKLLGRLSDRAKPESSCWRPGSSISRNPENSATSSPTSRPMLSPSSSIGSYSSEKSTLNPNAKEFKPNPNAKSFKPSPTATRPQSPVPEGSFYYPPLPPMPGIHIVYGMGAAFPGQHPVMYNNTPQQLGPNQTYYSPNSPQYPQQMMVGQQRPALFMPPSPYQPEMQYKGRDSY